ncbi:MAG: SRPBCC family protein [Sphingomonadales bacterium]
MASPPNSYAEQFVNAIFPAQYKSGALGRDRYTSPAFFESEWENVFTKTWQVAGRDVDIPEPGDYFTYELGPESFLIVRQEDGSIRAFYNVCQHRGNRLVHAMEGSQPSFTCDYHSWRWGIDGSLIAVQDEDDFTQGSPCGRLTLEEVRCEVFKTFIFINMDGGCIDLKTYLGPVWRQWQVYPIERMRRVAGLTVKLPSNWKALLDNFSEVYHFATVHAPFLDYMEDDYRDIGCEIFDEGHSHLLVKSGIPSRRHLSSGAPAIGQQLADELPYWELDPADFGDRPMETRVALQAQKRKLGPVRGRTHYDAMNDGQLTDVHHYTVFPNFAAGLHADGLLFHRLRPHASNPEISYYDMRFYSVEGIPVEKSTSVARGAGWDDGEAPIEYVEYGEKSLGPLLDSDVATMATQQKGMRSRGYRGAELADQEFRIAYYHHNIDRYIAGYRPGRTTGS